MSRTRMSWDWVGDYPIFVYTNFLNHNKFHVKVVRGQKGDQNASGYGPSAPAFFEYTSHLNSKDAVFIEALKKCEKLI